MWNLKEKMGNFLSNHGVMEIHEWEHERAKNFERANNHFMLGQDNTGTDGKFIKDFFNLR